MKGTILGFTLAAATVMLSVSSFSTASDGTYYRWKDEQGNSVHSDRPPPKGIDYDVVSTRSKMMRRVEASEGAVPAETEPSVGNEFEQTDPGEAEVTKRNPEYCQRARDNLATLNSSARIRLRDKDGEIRFLTEEEKEEQRQTALETISVHCE